MSDEKKNPALSGMPQDEQSTSGDPDKRLLIIRKPILEIKSGYVLRQVGQAYMVMPTGPRMKDYEGMITLNEAGAFLFKEVGKPDMTEEKLEQACIAEYDATPEEAKQAVTMFIQQCIECGLMDFEDRIFMPDGKEITKDDLTKPAPQ